MMMMRDIINGKLLQERKEMITRTQTCPRQFKQITNNMIRIVFASSDNKKYAILLDNKFCLYKLTFLKDSPTFLVEELAFPEEIKKDEFDLHSPIQLTETDKAIYLS